MASAGAFFAQAFERLCHEAMTRKFAATSDFKKMLAGIASLQDAQLKGYAPSNAQIAAISACISSAAEGAYGLPYFRNLPESEAASQLIEVIGKEVSQLNEGWRQARYFTFSREDLADMMEEARQLVAVEHARFAKA